MEDSKRRATMDVAMTARKGRISKALREQAEEGLERMARILGRAAHASKFQMACTPFRTVM